MYIKYIVFLFLFLGRLIVFGQDVEILCLSGDTEVVNGEVLLVYERCEPVRILLKNNFISRAKLIDVKWLCFRADGYKTDIIPFNDRHRIRNGGGTCIITGLEKDISIAGLPLSFIEKCLLTITVPVVTDQGQLDIWLSSVNSNLSYYKNIPVIENKIVLTILVKTRYLLDWIDTPLLVLLEKPSALLPVVVKAREVGFDTHELEKNYIVDEPVEFHPYFFKVSKIKGDKENADWIDYNIDQFSFNPKMGYLMVEILGASWSRRVTHTNLNSANLRVKAPFDTIARDVSYDIKFSYVSTQSDSVLFSAEDDLFFINHAPNPFDMGRKEKTHYYYGDRIVLNWSNTGDSDKEDAVSYKVDIAYVLGAQRITYQVKHGNGSINVNRDVFPKVGKYKVKIVAMDRYGQMTESTDLWEIEIVGFRPDIIPVTVQKPWVADIGAIFLDEGLSYKTDLLDYDIGKNFQAGLCLVANIKYLFSENWQGCLGVKGHNYGFSFGGKFIRVLSSTKYGSLHLHAGSDFSRWGVNNQKLKIFFGGGVGLNYWGTGQMYITFDVCKNISNKLYVGWNESSNFPSTGYCLEALLSLPEELGVFFHIPWFDCRFRFGLVPLFFRYERHENDIFNVTSRSLGIRVFLN